MPFIYQSWDCLLYPSGGEGFGLPVWEAMCSGLPIVYTNYSAHAELATLGGCGLPIGGVFQPEEKSCIWRMIADIPQAIEAVRRVYSDQPLRIKLGENGRAFANQFGIEVQVKEWHSLFQKVISF